MELKLYIVGSKLGEFFFHMYTRLGGEENDGLLLLQPVFVRLSKFLQTKLLTLPLILAKHHISDNIISLTSQCTFDS